MEYDGIVEREVRIIFYIFHLKVSCHFKAEVTSLSPYFDQVFITLPTANFEKPSNHYDP